MLLFLTLSAFFTYSCYFEYQARYEVESKKEYARLLEYNNKLILINFGDYLLLGNYEYNDFFDFEIIPSQDAGKFDVIEIK